jgi:predicted acylesterase/phospholipase RssA
VESSRPVEPTVPMVSLSSGARMTERLQMVCGDLDIEDAWIDYACVSTNLSTRERVVHRSGPAWRAVRASMSIPGVFPPVAENGDLLVDGGVVDNLPIGVLIDRHPGLRALAVDVAVHRDLAAGDLPDHTVVRGWHVLRDRLHPRRSSPQVVGIASVMARLAELGNRDSEDRDAADLIIRPEVGDVPLLDFGRFDELVESGYVDGRAALEAWQSDRDG